MGPWLVDALTRDDLDPWLDGTAPVDYRPVVMIVRGDDHTVREFLPNALDAAKLSEERVVLWVKNPSLFTDDELERFFHDDPSILAGVLDVEHDVKAWVYTERTDVDDAAFAFSKATGG